MTQRSILITGCSSGIGLSAVRIMKSRGWRVFATARRDEHLEHLTSGADVEALHLDLAKPATIAACAAEVTERTQGSLYALFNNGAYGQPGAIEDLPAETLRRQLEVNVIGTHDLTQRLLPGMLAQRRGRIVQNSSVLGLISGPFRGAYSASKFALEGLTDAMRMELAGSGIKVSLIEPGPIRTRFIENAIAAAQEHIDLENSRHAARYTAMISALQAGGRQTFKLEPEAVVWKLVHAVESKRPRRRYYVTTPTYMAAAAKRILPTAAIDWLALRN
ncbi:MAG TPA: SDR family NAD(P)-dependent oxidoreductase [Hyphomicrobiaceae bacterium]|nr:SDR family NAD(P)-dependent oxidoreductase [Hyphomicrobiaceae bacterium]